MCGICGFNWPDEPLVRQMTDVMAHRGPDQSGVYTDEKISLGHRRLSIIDLSEHGRQPMANEDGSIQLVFNGEIYNFPELRTELEAKGHQFKGHSDTEVIVHAYEEWGEEAIQRFNGMFAFALWDRRDESLLLVRDRIGIKPLYYYHAGGRFVFASEMKAILEAPEVPRELNHQALYAYLGFEFVPSPDTMFRGIRKLPAGHLLRLRNGEVTIRRYWDLSFQPANPMPSWQEAAEREIELLDEAVKLRLISDVPLGAFLSGGLDSSSIVAMMRRHITGKLQTFTIGYPDKTFSELDYAQRVADVFSTDHQILMIEDMTQELVEKSLWHLDEPMTDLSSIPLMLICREARPHATVCLSGEGGDESLAGYDRFKASRLDSYYRLIPSPLRRGVLSKLVAAMPDQPQKKGAINMLKRFVEGSDLPREGQHLRWQYFSSARHDANLFSDRFRDQVRFDPFARIREHLEHCDATDRVNREIYVDMRFMMAESVLMKVDKMSMANSLEIRVPLLDHKFVEYNASLPGSWKLRGMQTKAILRQALRGILPEDIVTRGKQGYSLPVKNILREQLRDYMVELLNDSPCIRENMNRDYVKLLIDEHLSFKHNHNHVLWGLMNTAIWHRRFVE